MILCTLFGMIGDVYTKYPILIYNTDKLLMLLQIKLYGNKIEKNIQHLCDNIFNMMWGNGTDYAINSHQLFTRWAFRFIVENRVFMTNDRVLNNVHVCFRNAAIETLELNEFELFSFKLSCVFRMVSIEVFWALFNISNLWYNCFHKRKKLLKQSKNEGWTSNY